MNRERIESVIEDFYKDFSGVRFDKWNYEDGCILIAAMQLYQATGRELFRDFVVGYMDKYVLEDGTIQHYKKEDYNLDNIAPGKALLFAYEQTGREKFMKAAQELMDQLLHHPRTASGNFWHKKIYPNQVWLDGLFMAQPFFMAFETKYGKKEHYIDIASQFYNVRKYMFDEEAKLYYHGYDESREVFWADPVTGRSKNFWLRATAWYQMAIVDTLEAMSISIYEDYRGLADLYAEGIKGLLRCQDKDTGLFYQVLDLPGAEGNYQETSGSAMLAASIMKACRQKVLLPEKYWHVGEAILDSVIERKLSRTPEGFELKDCCRVAGLGPAKDHRRDGSVEYYLSEPNVLNDNKAIAALFMAYAQYLLGRQTISEIA